MAPIKTQPAQSGKTIYYILAVSAIVIAAGLLFYGARDRQNVFAPGEVKKLGDNAFGELTGTSGAANESADAQSLAAGQAKGLGGGGGTAAAPMVTDSIARMESGGGGGVEGMIYRPVVYKYIYKGEALNLSEEKREVFRKNTDVNFGQNIMGALGGINFDLIDISKFSDAKLSYFNLTEDKELGYGISVDLNSGNVSIYNNDRGWYDYANGAATVKCLAPGCGGGNGLEISDIPADEVLIKMANDFITEKNINISQYGAPKIEDYWRRDYVLMAESGQPYYIPDVINVIYPLMINEQEVKDMGGGNYGLAVNVNIRKNKVSGLYGLGIYNLESSMYAVETDAEKILKIAEQGGWGYYYYPEEEADIVEIEIGEPELVYASHTNYRDGKYSELFVPALSFPILSEQEPYYYRQNIVVPLVKDLLNDENIYPRPMPLIEPAEPMPVDAGIMDSADEGGEVEGDMGTVGEVEAVQQ